MRSDGYAKPLVSVGVVTYNRSQEVCRCIQAVYDQTYPDLEVLVLDNCSPDDTADVVPKRFPEARFIRLHKNYGWPLGKNILSANCHGKYIFFLDDDLYLCPDAIEKAVAVLESRPEVAVVTGQTLDVETGEWQRTPGWRPGRSNKPHYVTEILGGHALFRREFLEEAGYYPDHSRYGGLDSFITLRGMDRGLLAYWSPEVLGYHEKSPKARPEASNFAELMKNRVFVAWAVHPWPYSIAGTVWPLWTYLKLAIRKGCVLKWLKTACVLPAIPIRALAAGRRPIRWTSMRLRHEMCKPEYNTPEKLLELFPQDHPVYNTCQAVIDGYMVQKGNREA
jgi:GT2 family glycosyltransferase